MKTFEHEIKTTYLDCLSSGANKKEYIIIGINYNKVINCKFEN